MSCRLASLILCQFAALSLAMPAAPAEPAFHDVQVRYQILAFRTERLRQFAEMTTALREAGFVRAAEDAPPPDEAENQEYTRMRGTIPAKGVAKLLEQRHVRTILLHPKDSKSAAKGTVVRVDLRLVSGYLPDVQRRLARQTALVLTRDLGFAEAVGYDRLGDTRLVGGVPVENLERILEDVRKLPAAADAAAPLNRISPVRVIYARPDWPAPSSRPAPAAVPPAQKKLSPELRSLLADTGTAGKRTRLEVILGWNPPEKDRNWVKILQTPGVDIEGRVGPLVTVAGVPAEVVGPLAARDAVVALRLPRSGRTGFLTPPAGHKVKWEPLRPGSLAQITALGRAGKGTRLALISDDFTGWEKLKGRKIEGKAMPDPVLLDLTGLPHRDLEPVPSASSGPGFGTRCAADLLQMHPAMEMTLIRLEGNTPFLLQAVARAINGESAAAFELEQRLNELQIDRASLDRRHEALVRERQRVLSRGGSDEEIEQMRREYQKKQDAHDAEEKNVARRLQRYLHLLRDLKNLRGVRVVATTLLWSDGQPGCADSSLGQFFDDRSFRAALWFQAAGDQEFQTWTGVFRDSDGNGVMEFSDPGNRLPVGALSHELNSLGWLLPEWRPVRGLPAGVRVRLSLQWREGHDPLPLKQGEDVYREPLAKLNLMVVHQPDPEGKTRPADDFQVVAQSTGSPVRLNQTANSATYEHVVELQTTKAGRYAVFVEGTLPRIASAPGENQLPGQQKFGEIRPRLFAQTLAGTGRVVWVDFVSPSR